MFNQKFNFSLWNKLKLSVFSILLGASIGVNAAVTGLQASHDATNAFYQFNFTGKPRFNQVYLDVDRNPNTGFKVAGLGADYLLENGHLLKYQGNGLSWNFSVVRAVSYTRTSSVAKWTVLRSAMGSPTEVLLAGGHSPETVTHVISQTLASPAPVGKPINMSQAYSDGGHAYQVIQDFGTPADSLTQRTVSTLRIFEDGKELGPAHASHADIRDLGQGRFSHWNNGTMQSLYLSASDNSDPTTNGRVYTYVIGTAPAPTPVPQPAPAPSGPARAFPEAEGFGTMTKAGRGGQILRVTNLNDSGTGSLRAALEATGPRTIVFEVSGTIPLSDNIRIRSPYVTLAGQSAPSPGITLRNAGLIIETHDVLIQHIRIRVGDTTSRPIPNDRDAIAIWGPSYNVVVDHISASWAVDENLSTWYAGLKDVTFSHCIISEGLNNSQKGTPHSKGLIIGDHSKNVSVIGNLFAHNGERQPLVKGDVSALIANNVSYNVGFHADTEILDVTEQGSMASIVSAVGNVYLKGPNTRTGYKGLMPYGSAQGFKVYNYDNRAEGGTVLVNMLPYNPIVNTPPVWTTPLNLLPNAQVEASVFRSAGARPADRDSVDARVVNEVKTRTGRIIDSQSQVGGWPVLQQNYRAFPAPINPNADDDGDGYTNVEEVLHQMAAQVEGRF